MAHLILIQYSDLKSTDLKKERKRNMVPAKLGVYGAFIFVINSSAVFAAFSLQVQGLVFGFMYG